MTFCQVIIGVALARSITGFEPWPVSKAITRRERIGRSIILLFFFALLAVVGGIVASMFGTGVARALGEIEQAYSSVGLKIPSS
jgi:hypothetical protein